MLKMAIGDMLADNSLVFIDPHGDAAVQLIDAAPLALANRIAYLDVTDPEYAFGFNPLAHVPPGRRTAAAEEMVSAFRNQWHDAWGARLEQNLRFGLRTLLDIPGSTLADLPRLFRQETFREWALRQISDPYVRNVFWRDEYGSWTDKEKAEYPQSLLNKVSAFLGSDTVRAILCQKQPSFDLATFMQRKRSDEDYDGAAILVVNSAKGLIGEIPAAILNALIVSHVTTQALSRITIREEERMPVSLFADEFGTYATSALASLLSEARKVRLQFVGGQQAAQQNPPDVLAALLTNCSTLFAFAVSSRDAELIAKDMEIDPAVLVGQFPFEARVRLAVRQLTKTLNTEDLDKPYSGHFEQVRAQSRERFARRRDVVLRGVR